MMAEDKMDKDLERQYRKNLMVVASIVLIYSIAGGKMAADLSMFGAKLQFSRPDLLEWAMVALMCFFWWRHWQVSGFIRAEIKRSNLRDVYLTNECEEMLVSALEKSLLHTVDCLSVFNDENNKVMIDIEKVSIFSVSVKFTYWDNSAAEHKARNLIFSVRTAPVIWVLIQASYLHIRIANAVKLPHFGDAVLPSVVFGSALLSWIFHGFHFSEPWQSEWCADLFNRL